MSEDEASEALDGLIDKQLARKVFPGNSRVDKYAHTGTSALKVEIGQLALLAELLMRGPQTHSRAAHARQPHAADRFARPPRRAAAARWRRAGWSSASRPATAAGSSATCSGSVPDLHPLDAPAPAAVAGEGAPEEVHAPTRAALSDRIGGARVERSSAWNGSSGRWRRSSASRWGSRGQHRSPSAARAPFGRARAPSGMVGEPLSCPAPWCSYRARAAPYHLEFDDVCMAFGERRVFDHLSFRFPAGRISVILGGSGSGKSTALRLIGGLIQPLAGHIRVDGDDVTQLSERQLYKVRGKLGMLFQGGALLDTHDGLRQRRLPAARAQPPAAPTEIADACARASTPSACSTSTPSCPASSPAAW